MSKNNSLFTIFLTLFVVFFSKGQDQKEVYQHGYIWNKVEASQFFGDDSPYGVGFDVIHRRATLFDNKNPFEHYLRTSVRPWFHKQFGPDARLSISPLGYFQTNPYLAVEDDTLSPSSYELRSTVQLFHHHKQMQGRLMHTWRYRLEFRNQKRDNEDDFRNFARLRLRYRLRYMLNAPDFYTQGVIYAAGSSELAVNMGSPIVYNTFNQNRIYLGIGFRFLNAARIELRYLDRFRSRGSGFEFDRGKGVMLSLTIDQINYLGRRYTQPIKYAD
jgi:hypothetical protein